VGWRRHHSVGWASGGLLQNGGRARAGHSCSFTSLNSLKSSIPPRFPVANSRTSLRVPTFIDHIIYSTLISISFQQPSIQGQSQPQQQKEEEEEEAELEEEGAEDQQQPEDMSKPVFKTFDTAFSDRLAAAIQHGPVALRPVSLDGEGIRK
jgi:hypothetical protein